jgi:hypothetical protein
VALLLHIHTDVNRRVLLVIAALLVPGGLIALVGAALIRAFARSSTGRRAWARVAAFWGGAATPLETLQRPA